MRIEERIVQTYKDKKILILGFGREGQSTYSLFRKIFPNKQLGISDCNQDKVLEYFKTYQDNNVVLHLGNRYIESAVNYDLVIKSPGLPLKNILKTIEPSKITSQTEIFLKLHKQKTIGITGTKGKSTTSSLLYAILKQYIPNIELIGNMGKPPFDYLINEDKDFYIFEMSSHQLENCHFSPHIAIMTNIYQEHLDHYISYQHYVEAKKNIYKHQNQKDIYIYNCDDLVLQKTSSQSRIYGYGRYHDKVNNKGMFLKENSIIYKDGKYEEEIHSIPISRKLLGLHNLYNILACLTVCRALNIRDFDGAFESIKEFKGLPHRLEYIGRYHDITFYNDSISTIPQTTISACNTIQNVDTLILGGLNRGIDYNKLIDYLLTGIVANVIFLPDVGHILYEQLKNSNYAHIKLFCVNELEEAVELAYDITHPNRTCLFSPAAASYGFFKNFEERGNKFKEYILKYAK